MKRRLFILVVLLTLVMGIVDAFYQRGNDYDALYYYGAGGNVETTATKDIGAGIGQNTIGEINTAEYNHAIYYGIFYINVTYSASALYYLPINLYIEDFGIEWIKLNWTM